ncbi:MAG: TIM barrel protein [Phycisphaerae bacterium]|nr:TIM barrel protein [Phycisphaerae bacterium]
MTTRDRNDPTITRRGAIGALGVTALAAAAHAGGGVNTAPAGGASEFQPGASASGVAMKGRINHSVCRWCYGMPLPELCKNAAGMGLKSVELLNPDEWAVAKEHGLTCAVANSVKSNPIPRGFNRVENHDAIVKELEERLPLVKEAGLPNQIVFSGNRGGQDDKEGIKNCIAGLKRITPLAEQLGVTIVMELLNSKDHTDYQCDHTPYGVAICEGVGSARFKLLYDIYHMQRMEGDVIDTIRKHAKHIGHYHTGGVPGRAEIDETQELNYATIMKAIVETGYTGYVGQEFIPRHDPMASLRKAVEICDV